MKKIDYYGTKDNYIHAKFGDLRKNYNFTEDFVKKYPRFAEEYHKYFMCEKSVFANPLEITNYIINYNLPIHAYFNFTDTPAKDWYEVQEYLNKEYLGNRELYKYEKDENGNYAYFGLDNNKMYVK